MSTTPDQIRTVFKQRLRDAFPGAQVTGYTLENPVAPGFEIELSPTGVEYDLAFSRGLDKWTWTVRGFVSLASAKGAQVNLDLWLAASGVNSVKQAIEGTDATLGGLVFDTTIPAAVPRTFGAANSPTQYLGAEWTVEILMSGV